MKSVERCGSNYLYVIIYVVYGFIKDKNGVYFNIINTNSKLLILYIQSCVENESDRRFEIV